MSTFDRSLPDKFLSMPECSSFLHYIAFSPEAPVRTSRSTKNTQHKIFRPNAHFSDLICQRPLVFEPFASQIGCKVHDGEIKTVAKSMLHKSSAAHRGSRQWWDFLMCAALLPSALLRLCWFFLGARVYSIIQVHFRFSVSQL